MSLRQQLRRMLRAEGISADEEALIKDLLTRVPFFPDPVTLVLTASRKLGGSTDLRSEIRMPVRWAVKLYSEAQSHRSVLFGALPADDLRSGSPAVSAWYFLLGHEYGHIRKNYAIPFPALDHGKKIYGHHSPGTAIRNYGGTVSDLLLAARLNEIHADFCGVRFGLGGNFPEAETALRWLITQKETARTDDLFHPFWEDRIRYLSTGSFHESLIRQAASEFGCENEPFVRTLVEFWNSEFF